MERIPCDPERRETPDCTLYRKIGRCYMDVHHLCYPKRDYKAPVSREFRNLEENKVYICRDLHDIEHAAFAPPEKPDMDIMRMAIDEERNTRKVQGQI